MGKDQAENETWFVSTYSWIGGLEDSDQIFFLFELVFQLLDPFDCLWIQKESFRWKEQNFKRTDH